MPISEKVSDLLKDRVDAQQLLKMLRKNKSIQLILERAQKLGLLNWYLGAGGIAQTVWNIKHGFDPENCIKDYDLVYYDAKDISYDAENYFIKKGKDLFKDIPIPVEIINEARVHLWYKKHFGKSINQYGSVEEAIDTWPTTATAVGVRKIGSQCRVYRPFGLDDLLNMIVRPNKVLITEQIYQDKVDRWLKNWPSLKVVPWGHK
ncbi:MAG: nucleotidyltransferase family protein [Candidatus Buchananbacteria bacterium]